MTAWWALGAGLAISGCAGLAFLSSWTEQRVGFVATAAGVSLLCLPVLSLLSSLQLGWAMPTHLPSLGRWEEAPAWARSVFAAAVFPTLLFLPSLLSRPWAQAHAGLTALGVVLGAGVLMLLTSSLGCFLLGFELLLLASLYLLHLTAKSERVLDAAAEMFFWTLSGSACLLVGFSALAARGVTTFAALTHTQALEPLLALLFIFGFGVKVPLWPCLSWLLKAHVEASVEFSILLSGFIVKLGALGLFRFLEAQPTGYGEQLLAALCTLAILEAVLRLPSQRDLKRIVALTTIIEMNWACFCLALGGALFEQVAGFLLVAHSFTTAAEFSLTEALYKRFNTRDVTRLGGLYRQAPMLWAGSLATALVTIGFPGTSLFAAKVMFLTALLPVSFGGFVLFCVILLLLLPVIFIRIWTPLWFGLDAASRRARPDLSSREVALFTLTTVVGLFLGLAPAAVCAIF